jgi:hypothetical protein
MATNDAGGSPAFTPGQAADATAAQRDEGAPVGTGPDPAALAGKVSAAAPDETDVRELLLRMQQQQDAMAAEITRLKAGGAAAGEHPLIGSAVSARDLIATHLDHGNLRGPDHGAALRLADDTVDAARNAVDSGDTSRVRDLAGRAARALRRIAPVPGENHYYRHALDFLESHIPDAADTVGAPVASGAPAVTSSQPPARVVAGSVTG